MDATVTGRSIAEIIDPSTYETGYPHALWDHLRSEAPVCLVDAPRYGPFWAVTSHAAVAEVSRDPGRFSSAGRWLMLPEAVDIDGARSGRPPLRMLVNMDPPEHRDYRRVASGWFTPRNLTRLEDRIRAQVRTLLLELTRGADGYCEVVNDLAAGLPLRVIMELLGIPRTDAEFVLRLSNENFGAADSEFRRTAGERDGFLRELGDYLLELGRQKRTAPQPDLASEIATARIDGRQIPDFELMSYLYLIATAGHETTRNAISGGLLALAEHPSEYQRLRDVPGKVTAGVEEILRWTSPIVHFARTATQDCVLAGKNIREGDSIVLFYPAANRDDNVFVSPHAFVIDRDPNPHLAFGVAEHYCLGAGLARLEIRILLEEMVDIVERIEIVGARRRLRSSFVGGLKHFPARLAPKSGRC